MFFEKIFLQKNMKMVDEDGWMLEFRAESDTKWSALVVARVPGGFRPKNPKISMKNPHFRENKIQTNHDFSHVAPYKRPAPI